MMKRILSSRVIVYNFVRNKSEMYQPGQGLRTLADIEEEKKLIEKSENDPMAWTIFGNRRVKTDPFHYSDRKAGKGYSDFSNEIYPHRPYIWQPIRKYFKFNWYLMFGLVFIAAICPYDMGEDKFGGSAFKPFAATLDQVNGKDRKNAPESDELEENDSESDVLPEDSQKKKKKKNIGFRERRIIEYENRLRAYSSPDKIFRYFATLKVYADDGSYNVYMTPEDFVRSLTPGVMQPRNLGLDKFKIFDPKKHKPPQFKDPDCIFHKLGNYGLIDFTDYLFLMTLLSMPRNEFRLAFSIFDQKGDGELDKNEFAGVQKLLISQTTVGQKHRDHVLGASSFKWSDDSSITNYFFGEDGKQKLTIETLLIFQHDLHRDILKIEFERRDPESNPVGIISEISFAELLLMHAGLPDKRQKRMIKRVKKKYKNSQKGISFDEVNDFFQFIYFIDNVDMALHFYKLAGKSLSKELLTKVARKIANAHLTEHLVDVVITLFDENNDNELSHKEFVALMKKRMQRGLEKPKDTGLLKLLDAMWECSKGQFFAYLEETH